MEDRRLLPSLTSHHITKSPLELWFLKPKDKEKILKTAKEKALLTYKGSLGRLTANFSSEAMEAKRQRDDRFKVLKEKKTTTCQPKFYLWQNYPSKEKLRHSHINKS